MISAPLSVFVALQLSGAPDLRLETTTKAAEKGHIFDILVTVQAESAVDSLIIVPTLPESFSASLRTPPDLPGLSFRPGAIAMVARLEPGATLTLRYRIATPSQTRLLDWLRHFPTGDSVRALDTPRDPKVFTFTTSFLLRRAGRSIRSYRSAALEVPYTTSSLLFLIAGLIGVLLGFAVKTLTQQSTLLRSALTPHSGFWGRLRGLGRFLFVERLPYAITTSLIGFGVLVTQIRAGIPAGGWVNALAIGIGLGVFADDALLTKLPKTGPSGPP